MQNTAQDRAYLHVKDQILSLTLKPGQWIKAQDIATEVRVSRTPVREALGRLEQEGFVRRDEGWGYIVTSVTLKDARELYRMREVLEVEAVREAAVNVITADLETLDVLLRRADQARQRKKVQVFRENTRTFHATISRMANNALLAKMLKELEHRVQFLGAMVFEKRTQRMDEVIEENSAILEALRRSDAVQAESAVRRHVRRGWENYLHYVAEGAGFSAAMKGLDNDGRGDGQATIR